MRLKTLSAFALLAILPGLCSCSLVTVPVETAGGVVKSTVKTSGRVAEAPFKAAGGGYR